MGPSCRQLCVLASLLLPSGRVATSLPNAPKQAPSFQWLDENHRISVAKAFVSKSERDYLLDLIRDQSGGWAPTPTGGKRFLGPANTGDFQAAVRRDPVVARLEARIANVTGIPPHRHEDMLSVAKIKSRDNHIRDGYYTPFGLHHETDGRPYRAVTILVYLKSPKEGGRTVFPLCNPPSAASDPATPTGQRHAEFTAALESMWGNEPQKYARQAAIDPQVSGDHPFMDLLEGACRGEYGVAVAPVAGMALRFEHILPDGSYNTATWHDGCNVVSGSKIILQKFKELPEAQRRAGDPGVWTVDSGVYKGRQLPKAGYNAWDPIGGYPGSGGDGSEGDGGDSPATERKGGVPLRHYT